jgi:hypothetical protein
MPDLPNGRDVGPIATLGRDRKAEVLRRLGVPGGARLVLVTFGGMGLDTEGRWPRLPRIQWLLAAGCGYRRPDCHRLDAVGVPFVDLMASADLVVTKPGYGTFTEAACNGTAVLYARRQDWPESPHLEAWLHQHAHAVGVGMRDLLDGELEGILPELMSRAPKAPPAPTGIAEAAELLAGYLGSHDAGDRG